MSGSWKEADILPPLSIQGIFVVFFKEIIFLRNQVRKATSQSLKYDYFFFCF